MSIRNHANDIRKRVKGVFALDDSGYCYQVDYWDGDFQQFRIGMVNAEIVYISPINTII